MAKHLAQTPLPPRTRRKKKKGRIIRLIWTISYRLLILYLIVNGGHFLWQRFFSPKTTSQPQSSQTVSSSNQSSSRNSNESDSISWKKQSQPVKIPILMYHAIHVMDPSEAANAGLIVDPETFESHLKALKDAGYYTLTPEEAHKVLTENVLPENKKVVWLTFDDSMADFYSNAFPLLKNYQMKATNNVITGFVQEGRPSNLTLAQMKEMKKAGLSFEDHTVNHPDLEISDSTSQESELRDSKDFLDQELSQKTTTVAYPAGRYSDITLQIAENLGYKLGLTTNEGLASLDNGLLSLNRIRINPTTSAEELLSRINP